MIPIYSRIPAPPSGAETKRRAAATKHKKATDEARRALMLAKDLLVNQDRELRARRDYLAAMVSERDGLKAEMVRLRARLDSIKGDALPQADAKVAAAKDRLNALAENLDRAERIANAEAIVAQDAAR